MYWNLRDGENVFLQSQIFPPLESFFCLKIVPLVASQVTLVVKNPPANAGDVRDAVSIPGSGRFPGGGQGNPVQYSCLENPMDRGAWRATVHRVAKSWTRLKPFSTAQHSQFRGLPRWLSGKDVDSIPGWGSWSLAGCRASVAKELNTTEHLYSNNNSSFRMASSGTFLVVQWVGLDLPIQGVCVQSLIGELKSYAP